MKFKVGDKVRVKQEKDIDTSGFYGWTSWMDRMSGKEYILDQKSGNCWKLPDEDGCLWSFKEDWLEKIEEIPKFKVGDKVQIKSESDIEQRQYGMSAGRSGSIYFDGEYSESKGIIKTIDNDGDLKVHFGGDLDDFNYFHPSWIEDQVEKKITKYCVRLSGRPDSLPLGLASLYGWNPVGGFVDRNLSDYFFCTLSKAEAVQSNTKSSDMDCEIYIVKDFLGDHYKMEPLNSRKTNLFTKKGWS